MYSKCSDLIKHLIENGKDAEIKPPTEISATDAKNKIKWYHYCKEYDNWIEKKNNYEDGKKKLYSLLWGQCTLMMQHEIEAMEDYNDMKDNLDSIN